MSAGPPLPAHAAPTHSEGGATNIGTRDEPSIGMSKKAILVVALVAVALIYVTRR